MLINFYRKTLDIIAQWFELTGTIINTGLHPVRVRIKEFENFQPYDMQRKMRALKHKR